MSDVIKLLPDSVANQIAAGEVIQRPASVIKELVENAIDAEATSVQIILKDAGRTLIQIIDNGVGMTDTDARLAFERHSTSKIRKADDLFTLHTMGFRGEALASIAAISQVELRTRRHEAPLGTKLIINASVCESQEPDMCPAGSNFMIKNLFFNVPARRKFLKSNQVELSNIVKEFEKLALANSHVEFTLIHNGSVMYKLLASNFLQRIAAVMGKSMEQQLLPLDIDTELVRVSGYVGKPENARKRGAQQFFFVNGRFMRHPYFHKAVITCYDQLIPADEQPSYFLVLDVDPETIDVNIHPTKTEIKFENEMPIWQILAAGVKATLGRFNEVPSIDFDRSDAPDIPVLDRQQPVKPPTVQMDKTYNPFKQDGAASTHRQQTTDWEQLYRNFERKRQQSLTPTNGSGSPGQAGGGGEESGSEAFLDPHSYEAQATVPHLEQHTSTLDLDVQQPATLYLQMKGRFIVGPIKSGLMIIDQHRAHINVLFARYMRQMADQKIVSQTILFPEVLHLDHARHVVLCGLVPELEKIGFTISQLGAGDWSVSAMPAGLEGVDVSDLLQQVIDDMERGGAPIKSRVMEHIALKVASAAAIPYGRRMAQEEMDVLVAELFQLANPNYTPDGHVVMSVIPNEQIMKLF
ncbi:MAG: DNA mismatch repair endonuclease MutL [Muribaculaceae bacterium]|nr:DNA mismatch repair endonuclease MutL [Muribaculaceae bacterium]